MSHDELRALLDWHQPEWMTRGACRGMSADLFIPETFNGKGLAWHANMARRVCAGCPVRDECLEHALTTNEPHGIWGGFNRKERQKIARQRKETQT